MVRLTDRPDITIDVYRGRKSTKQKQQQLEYERCLIICHRKELNHGFFVQSNFNGSNTFGTMKISSRQGSIIAISSQFS